MNEFNSNIDDLFTDSNNNTNNNHVNLMTNLFVIKSLQEIIAAFKH